MRPHTSSPSLYVVVTKSWDIAIAVDAEPMLAVAWEVSFFQILGA